MTKKETAIVYKRFVVPIRTGQSFSEAAEKLRAFIACDLRVSHHPFGFGDPKKSYVAASSVHRSLRSAKPGTQPVPGIRCLVRCVVEPNRRLDHCCLIRWN
jgi:hypothetical protein